MIRGALGSTLRAIACVPDCRGARECELRQTCGYAQIFEPFAGDVGPSGLQDQPRPFVLRAAHLDGRTIGSTEPFSFDIHLFLTVDPPLAYFILAFAQLAESGLGPSRGRVRLQTVDVIGAGDEVLGRVFDSGEFQLAALPAPIEMDLTAVAASVPATTFVVEFLTPTELKNEGQIVGRPEFFVLISRVRDRLGNLTSLYGDGLELDWTGLTERARAVRLMDSNLRTEGGMRMSTKTGQTHALAGFVGTATYEGSVGEFLPLLRVAVYTGVGRQTVWGKGHIRILQIHGE